MAEDKEMNKKEEMPGDLWAKRQPKARRLFREVIEKAVKDVVEIAESPTVMQEDPAEHKLKKEIRAALVHVDRVRKQAQKTQAEIDKLKKETRALIKEMQAA
jgi:hypothetical protein